MELLTVYKIPVKLLLKRLTYFKRLLYLQKYYKYNRILYLMIEVKDLPEDIVRTILDFVPREKLVFVNHTYYDMYHNLIRKNIINYESYIRDLIRRDNYIVYKKIVGENIDSWINCRNYRYKDMVFNNYIYFILYFCIENNSERCRKILIEELNLRDLCRNLHKKNVIKYIKWKI
jgi:hypothetical protein